MEQITQLLNLFLNACLLGGGLSIILDQIPIFRDWKPTPKEWKAPLGMGLFSILGVLVPVIIHSFRIRKVKIHVLPRRGESSKSSAELIAGNAKRTCEALPEGRVMNEADWLKCMWRITILSGSGGGNTKWDGFHAPLAKGGSRLGFPDAEI